MLRNDKRIINIRDIVIWKDKRIEIILPPTGKKVHLVFFALRALQFWEMALFFLLLPREIWL